MAAASSAFSSSEATVIEREISTSALAQLTAQELDERLDIQATAEHVTRGFRRVALQFPDELIGLPVAGVDGSRKSHGSVLCLAK